MAYAVTNIKHSDGEILAGEEVDRSLFTDEEWTQLVTAGALTTQAPAPEEVTAADEQAALLAEQVAATEAFDEADAATETTTPDTPDTPDEDAADEAGVDAVPPAPEDGEE